jgi:hypothetical protein
MSGYTGELIARDELTSSGFLIVENPFTRTDLQNAIAEASGADDRPSIFKQLCSQGFLLPRSSAVSHLLLWTASVA